MRGNINKLLREFKILWDNGEYDKVKAVADEIDSYYKRNNLTNTKSYACYLYNLSLYFIDTENYSNAVKAGLKACEIMADSKDKVLYSSFLNNLGVAYSLAGDKGKGLGYFKKCHSLRSGILEADDSRICDTAMNIGSVYYDLGKYEQALAYHRDALKRRKNQKDEEYINNLNLIGYDFEKLKKNAQAIEHLKEAVSLMDETDYDKGDMIANMCYLAALYARNGEYNNSISLYEKGLYMLKREKLDKEPYSAEIMNKTAEVYAKAGNDKKALELRLAALSILEAQVGNRNLFFANCLKEIARLYEKNNLYGDAITYLQRDLEIKSSVISVDEKEYLDDAIMLADIYKLNNQTKKSNDILEYLLANITPKNPKYSKIILTLVSRFMDENDVYKLYSLYDKYKLYDPTVTYDEMLILAMGK